MLLLLTMLLYLYDEKLLQSATFFSSNTLMGFYYYCYYVYRDTGVKSKNALRSNGTAVNFFCITLKQPRMRQPPTNRITFSITPNIKCLCCNGDLRSRKLEYIYIR